jgi:hypothetical protein
MIKEEIVVVIVFSVLHIWNTILWMKEYRDEYPNKEEQYPS